MRLRMLVAVVLVVLAGALGYTANGWMGARSQARNEQSNLAAQEASNARSLSQIKTAYQRELLTATSGLESELQTETKIAQAETALANQPVYVTVAPTTTTTPPPPTPLQQCLSSGQWVYDLCQNVQN